MKNASSENIAILKVRMGKQMWLGVSKWLYKLISLSSQGHIGSSHVFSLLELLFLLFLLASKSEVSLSLNSLGGMRSTLLRWAWLRIPGTEILSSWTWFCHLFSFLLFWDAVFRDFINVACFSIRKSSIPQWINMYPN